MDACLNNFKIVTSKQDCLKSLTLADQSGYIYQVLGYHRLMLACDNTDFHAFYGHGRISKPLRTFITTCQKIYKT